MTRLALEGPRVPLRRHPCSSLAAAPVSSLYCRRSSSSSLRRYSSGSFSSYSSYSSYIGKACCTSSYVLPHVSSYSAAHSSSSSSKRSAQSAEYPPVSASHIIATHLEQQMQQQKQQQTCSKDTRSLFESVVDAIERHILHSDPSGNVRLSARRLNIGRCPEVPEHTATFALRRSGSLHWLSSEDKASSDTHNSSNEHVSGLHRRKNNSTNNAALDADSDGGSSGSGRRSLHCTKHSGRGVFPKSSGAKDRIKNHKGATVEAARVTEESGEKKTRGASAVQLNQTATRNNGSTSTNDKEDANSSDLSEKKMQHIKATTKRRLLGHHSVSVPKLTDPLQKADGSQTCREDSPPSSVGLRRTFSWHGLKSRFKK